MAIILPGNTYKNSRTLLEKKVHFYQAFYLKRSKSSFHFNLVLDLLSCDDIAVSGLIELSPFT